MIAAERLADIAAGNFVTRAEVRALAAEVARWRTETQAPPLAIHGCACRACEILRRQWREDHERRQGGGR